jgi:hypothetical protein
MHRPPSQTVAHEPQLVLLVEVLTHWLPHSVSPVMHLHEPAWHVAAAGQVVPHVPQLKLLVCRSTHCPLQTVWPAVGHLHAPLWQVVPPVQTVPHLPQSRLFVCRSTH